MSNEHREQAREIIGNIKNYECEWNGISQGAFKSLSIRIASALSSRDAEVREVLEGLRPLFSGCWCSLLNGHTHACDAARALYSKLQAPEKGTEPPAATEARGEVTIPKRSRRKSRKDQLADELKESDLSGQLAGRDNIEYGPHDSLPRGEHVARLTTK